MSDFEKINIYVPDEISRILDHDANLFEIRKKDGISINRNRFYTLLLTGYYDAYMAEYRAASDRIMEILDSYDLPRIKKTDLADTVLREVMSPDIPKRKGKNPAKLSLKPTAETESLINSILDQLGGNDYISQYFCRMFVSYTKKPLYEREKIIFRSVYEKLYNYCSSKQAISFSTIWDKHSRHIVVPYRLVVGKDEMFHYLLCAERNPQTGCMEARSYRLNRISSPVRISEPLSIPEEIRHYLDRMAKNSPQFAINDDTDACIQLTDKGLVLYDRIYTGRPEYSRIEHKDGYHICHFSCSEDQLFLYFCRFSAGNAIVMTPKSLKERMTDFYKNNLDAYTE